MDFMTHLTVALVAATVIAVDHSQSVSLGDWFWIGGRLSPRRQLQLAAGPSRPDRNVK